MMKKLLGLFTLLTLTLTLAPAAFAVDQITLSSGETLEGKVLSDVPNRHVDFQTLNGIKKRYPRSEVTQIERDIPSNKVNEMYGSDSRVYFGATLGGYKVISAGGGDVRFNYGGRFGVNVAQLGDFSKFAFGLAFNRSSVSNFGISTSVNELMVQLLFRKIANSGFYFGPEFGLAFISSDFGGLASSSTNTDFDVGGLVGYDYYFSPSFSVGPEVHVTHASSGGTILKFLLSGTFHFE